MIRPAVLRLSALLLLVVLAGCSRPTRPAPPPPATPSANGFPVTLTDAQHVSVTVPQPPQRIISIAPTVTEMLFAIGAGKQVVAVTEQCSYPPEVKRLPKVGQWWQPSAERALALRPDLVIGQRGNPPDFITTMRKTGCRTFTIAPQTLADIRTDLLQLGELTGHRPEAARVNADIQRRLEAIAKTLAAVPEQDRPTVFAIAQVSPVWTAGRGTFQDEAIRAAGARNAGASVQDFREFSVEKLLAADPDFLLVSAMAQDPNQMKREVLANPALKRLTAAKRGRILALDADLISRPGPRLIEAIEAMARTFYPDCFPAGGST